MKNSFILFTEYVEYIEDLTAEQCGYLLKAIFEYEIEGKLITELDISTKIVFKIIKNNLDRANEKYIQSVENGKKGAEHGLKGGRPKPPNNPPITPTKPLNNNDNVNECVNDNDNVNNKKTNRFTPPTIEEVKEFCLERKNTINPEAFVAFYDSKGWKIGKEPMRDWRKCMITWEINEKEKEKNANIRASPNKIRCEKTFSEIVEEAEERGEL